MRAIPLLLMVCACTAAPPTPPGSPAAAPRASGVSAELRAFQLLNDARAAGGCPPLVWSDTAARVAAAHSRDMAARNYFAHVGPDGVDPGRRLTGAGIAWRRIGENIAHNPAGGPEDVVQQWLGSPPHRGNVMSCDFTHSGVGHASGRWTQVFYTPR
jgi:uncharacterized protein YkwD